MKIVIPGGSGQVGTILARALHADGHDVVVLSRQPPTSPWRSMAWDGATSGLWVREIDGSDVVINLAGRSVNCRYTPNNRREILESRVNSTRAVGEAIAQARRPPRAWLQASTATIYAHRYDAPNVSWIHFEDFVRATRWLIFHEEIEGAVNVAAPKPVPNEEFMRALREAAGTRVGLPATKWMLEVGARFMRTETELILKSRRVVPARLLQGGFAFTYPIWNAAACDLCQRWMAAHQQQSTAA